MIQLTSLPPNARIFLAGAKGCFRYRHALILNWMIVLHLVSSGKSDLRSLSRMAPDHIKYQHLRRFLAAGYWSFKTLIHWFGEQAIQALSPPPNGVLFLLGDSTYKGKRGKKNPVVKKGKIRATHPFLFGIQIVFLVVHWGVYRIPVDFEIIRRKNDPEYVKENELFRRMLAVYKPPSWAKKVIVLADAAYASRANFKFIISQGWFFLMGIARSWVFEDGKSLRNLVNHLPPRHYKRTWVPTINGKHRATYWTFAKRTRLRHIGDVTMVLSKKRRNLGPKATKILVTNLPNVTSRDVVQIYQRRWNVELLIWELKGAMGLGQHQVTKKVDRVERSIAVSVIAYQVLIKLRAKDIPDSGSWSAFTLKQNITWDVGLAQLQHSAEKLARKSTIMRLAA